MRIGVYVCHCGGNISEVVNIDKVVEAAKQEGDVVLVKDNGHLCSNDGQSVILQDIKEYKLDKVVISACSPQFQGMTFKRVMETAGLNPYVLGMANIREQCSWAHYNYPEEATDKAVDTECTGFTIYVNSRVWSQQYSSVFRRQHVCTGRHSHQDG